MIIINNSLFKEQFKSGMMLETVTEAFVGLVGPAFGLVMGPMANEDRAKKCEAFHNKVRENAQGKPLVRRINVRNQTINKKC